MPHETLHVIDWMIVVCYLGVIAYLGKHFSEKQKSTNDHFVGDRSIPAWAIGMSVLATLISSVTFLAYPGEGFNGNWIRLVQGLAVPAVLLAIIWFIVPMYRRIIGLSAYEYFEKRFGYFARLYSSVAFIMAHFTKMGTVFYLLALALASMTGLNTYHVVLVVGVVTILYTLFGGIEGVIWMDVIQGFILIGGGVTCMAVLLLTPAQGPVEVLRTAWQSGKMGMGPYDWDFTRLTFVVMAINGVFYAIQKYGTDQTIVQRFLVAQSHKKAIKAALMGALLCVPVWTLFIFIGTLLWVYYRMTPVSLPPEVTGDKVFPWFIMSQRPAGVTGLILAVLFSAAMSSLDSDLTCLAAVGVDDYYRRFKKNATDRQCLALGKIIVVVCGVLAVGIACLYVRLGGEAILGTVLALYAIFSGGIAGIFLLGFFTLRANRRGLNVGIAACVLFTAYALLTSTKFDLGGPERQQVLDLGRFSFPHHKYMLGVYSHIVLFVIGYAASFLFEADKDTRSLTFYGWMAGMVLSVNGFAQAQDLIQISDAQTWANFDEGGLDAGDTLQILAGADLTVNGRSAINAGMHVIVEEGGAFTINDRLDLDEDGVITMNGGTFTCNGDFKFPDNATAMKCHVWLYGGLMVCAETESRADRGSTLHVGGGLFQTGNALGGGRADPSATEHWNIVTIPPYANVVITELEGQNMGGQLYVEINNTRIDYLGDASAVTQLIWTQWTIDLDSVITNLQRVETLTLGIEGAGSSGVLYIDDIRLYEEAPATASEQVWIEAESADTITLPVEAGSDSAASGGQYIGTPNGFGNTAFPPAADGIATYSLTVKDGAYQMQFRVISSDGDSFWVRVPTATTSTGNHPSGWILNDLNSSSSWLWDDVNSCNDGGDTVVFTMSPGTHTLDIAYRDDGAFARRHRGDG